MTYMDWKKNTVDEVDELVHEMLEDLQPDWDDVDLIDAAAGVIDALVVKDDVPRDVYVVVAKDLATAWIRYIYRNWYTGSVSEEKNLAALLDALEIA